MNVSQPLVFMLFAGFEPNYIIPAVGLLLITISLLMRVRKRKMQKSSNKPLTPDEHIEKVRQAKGVRADLEDIMVEIEQMAKRMGAQLDNKSARLEALIEQADKRINELKQAQRESPGRSGAGKPNNNASTNARDESPSEAPQPSEAAEPPEPPEDPLATSIYALADAGHDPIHIAQKLSQDVGKIELILALRSA